MIQKIFEGEMLIRTQPTTLLQIFFESMFDSKVIIKNIKDPDDTFYLSSKHECVKVCI